MTYIAERAGGLLEDFFPMGGTFLTTILKNLLLLLYHSRYFSLKCKWNETGPQTSLVSENIFSRHFCNAFHSRKYLNGNGMTVHPLVRTKSTSSNGK